MSGLFGVIQPGTNNTITVPDDIYREMLHVFPSEEWPGFYAKYQELYAAAKSPLIRTTLKVSCAASYGFGRS